MSGEIGKQQVTALTTLEKKTSIYLKLKKCIYVMTQQLFYLRYTEKECELQENRHFYWNNTIYGSVSINS